MSLPKKISELPLGDVVDNSLIPHYNPTTGQTEAATAAQLRLGDVSGPASSVDKNMAEFLGTGGKTLADSGISAKSIKNYLGTGLISGCTLSINTDTTKIDIASGVGVFVNNSSPSAPTLSLVTLPAVSAITLTNLASAEATYIARDSAGTVIQKTTPFTPIERRSYVVLGAAIHSNRTVVNLVNNLPDVAIDGICQLNDLIDGLRNFNIGGNVYSANGANLNVNKSEGYIFKRGSNFSSSNLNPHTLLIASQTAPADMRYRLRDGTEYANTAAIDPEYYDNAGVKTAVPVNKWTAQRLTLFPSGKTRIQYGQHTYGSAALAIQGLSTDTFVTEQNISDNGLLRCVLIVQQGTTALNSSASAIFFECDRFGGTASAVGGSATTTIQQAYNNSSQPQIVTDATRGALQIKRGSAADTDKILEALNGAGDSKFSLLGNGHIDLGHSVNDAQGADIASATTTDIGAATGNFVKVTGTTTITGLGTVQAGTERTVMFTGVLILTHNATSLILPTAANITTAVNDRAIFRSLGSGNWVCIAYQRADGSALAGASSGGFQELVFQDYQGPAIEGLLGTYTATRTGTIGNIRLVSSSLPVGSNAICELRKNSLTSGNILSATLQITTTESATNGQYIGTVVSSFSSTAIAAGDVFYLIATSVGSTTPAQNLRGILYYT